MAIVALYSLPLIFGAEVFDWYTCFLPALLVVTATLAWRAWQIDYARERRFWYLLCLAFGFWSIAGVLRVFLPTFNDNASGLLLEDLFYLGYYLGFLYAIEMRPHLVIPKEILPVWQERRRYEIEGAAVFVTGLLIYFTFIPMSVSMGEYRTFYPADSLYVTIDLLILIRLLYTLRGVSSERWRILYGLLLISSLLLTATDLFDAVIFFPGGGFGLVEEDMPPLLYALWFLFFFPFVWGARLRHILPVDGESIGDSADLIRERSIFNILLVYTVLLPTVHLFFQYLDFLDQATSPLRSLTVLIYILVLGVIVHRQISYEEKRTRTLERERREFARGREQLIAELEAKSTELEHFTYTVSHDLRSPIITIQGFLGWLEKDAAAGETERVVADVSRIRTATEKMSRLLDDLLELSRVGRVMNKPERVALGDLARSAADQVEGAIRQRGVDLVIASDLPEVLVDKTRLMQVFQNLIENAVKYMGDQSRPRIEISARVEAEELVVRVRDNGIGLDTASLEQVFELFTQLNGKDSGSGVGLALVRRIVEVHGGRVWVESDGVGQGCAVFFTLPILSRMARANPESVQI